MKDEAGTDIKQVEASASGDWLNMWDEEGEGFSFCLDN